MAHAVQRRPASIDVSDPHLYQDDTWRPLAPIVAPSNLANFKPLIRKPNNRSVSSGRKY